MFRSIIAVSMFVASFIAVSSAQWGTGGTDRGLNTCTGWTQTVWHDANGDHLSIWNLSSCEEYTLDAQSVTPAQFALASAMVNAFFVKDDRAALHIVYNPANSTLKFICNNTTCYSHQIYFVDLAGK